MNTVKLVIRDHMCMMDGDHGGQRLAYRIPKADTLIIQGIPKGLEFSKATMYRGGNPLHVMASNDRVVAAVRDRVLNLSINLLGLVLQDCSEIDIVLSKKKGKPK